MSDHLAENAGKLLDRLSGCGPAIIPAVGVLIVAVALAAGIWGAAQ